MRLTKKKIQEIENLKIRLRQTIWPPMTYMMIPSVLKKADEIIDELSKSDDPEIISLKNEISELKKNFRREKF